MASTGDDDTLAPPPARGGLVPALMALGHDEHSASTLARFVESISLRELLTLMRELIAARGCSVDFSGFEAMLDAAQPPGESELLNASMVALQSIANLLDPATALTQRSGNTETVLRITDRTPAEHRAGDYVVEDCPCSDEECPVCLEPMAQDVARLPCGHLLHGQCLAQMVCASESDRCPLCRQQADLIIHPATSVINKDAVAAYIRILYGSA